MKKKIATVLVALLVLFPKTSRADLDVLSIIQDAIKVFQEKANTLVQGYIGIQVNLQELALNRDILGSLRDSVKEQLEAKARTFIADAKDAAWSGAKEFFNSQMSAVTLPGINTSISLGPYTSPIMKQKVGKSYMKRTNVNNDVKVMQQQDFRNNNLMVENLAIIYANALVTRKKMIDEEGEGDENGSEDDEEGTTNTDVSTVQFRYGQTARHAAYLWMQLLRFESTYHKAFSEMRITEGRQDDISEIIGQNEDEMDTEGLEDVAEQIAGERESVDILALRNRWTSGVDALKRGDYGDVLRTAGDAYGNLAVNGNKDIVDMVQRGTSGAGSAYDNIKDGNWSNLSSGVGNTVGGMIGGNTGSEVGALGDFIGGGINVGTSGGNANDVFDNLLTNGGIQDGLDKLSNLDTSAEEARRAAEEAARQKEQEERLKQMQQITQELKQKACDECKAEAEKNPKKSCIAACSL